MAVVDKAAFLQSAGEKWQAVQHLLDKGQDEGEGRQAQARRQQREHLLSWRVAGRREVLAEDPQADLRTAADESLLR